MKENKEKSPETQLVRDLLTNSYQKKPKRNSSITFQNKTNEVTEIERMDQNPKERTNLNLNLKSKLEGVSKRPNLKVQAALFQGRVIEKNLRAVK